LRNFAEGMDALVNSGLDGLPTANKLYIWLCSQAEADVTAATVLAGLTKVGTTVAGKTGLSSSSRVVDLGSADFSAETSGSVKSVVVSTDDPGTAGSKALAIQDLNGGTAINLATATGLIVDDLSIQIGYLASGTVG